MIDRDVTTVTALDRAFAELHEHQPARRVYASTNMIAMAMRTLAGEWQSSESKALRDRAPGMIEAARRFEHEAATLMAEVVAK